MTRERLAEIKAQVANLRVGSPVRTITNELIAALEDAYACIERIGSPVWPEDGREAAQEWADTNLEPAPEKCCCGAVADYGNGQCTDPNCIFGPEPESAP